jgi:hypothetical protein
MTGDPSIYKASEPCPRLVYAWEGEVAALKAEITRLQSALDTCRELREYDAAEIERLRAVNSSLMEKL